MIWGGMRCIIAWGYNDTTSDLVGDNANGGWQVKEGIGFNSMHDKNEGVFQIDVIKTNELCNLYTHSI